MRLFLVEDDAVIANALEQHLTGWGYECVRAKNFANITAEFAACAPQLVLLDIGLPFYNGYHWCAEIRKLSKVPILFLSSASDNLNIVMAMNMGGDDFIAKPFALEVLTAKVQALLRRSYDFGAANPELAEHDGAVLNGADRTLTVQGKTLELTKNEYRILQVLWSNSGEVVSRETLMERLWETDSYVDENTLTVNVTRLRKKLAEVGLAESIVTRKGVGYMVK